MLKWNLQKENAPFKINGKLSRNEERIIAQKGFNIFYMSVILLLAGNHSK